MFNKINYFLWYNKHAKNNLSDNGFLMSMLGNKEREYNTFNSVEMSKSNSVVNRYQYYTDKDNKK